MTDWRDEHQSVQYRFRLNGEDRHYSLQILESPNGNLETSLSTESSSLPFSTRDRDNDRKHDFNCAKHLSGEHHDHDLHMRSALPQTNKQSDVISTFSSSLRWLVVQ